MASRRPARTARDIATIVTIYKPIERAALAKYFNIKDPVPRDLKGIDVSAPVDPEEWDEDEGGIAPLRGGLDNDGLMLENVVARICLQSEQRRLPQWASVSLKDGTVTLARRIPRSRKTVPLLGPTALFTINWADSGPGFSWPEKYYVTHLPGYDISVVTGSTDGPETHGCADFAIGWFPGAELRETAVRTCVTSWWHLQRGDGQDRWAYLFDTGWIDSDTAKAWADEVWGKAAENESEEEDADVRR